MISYFSNNAKESTRHEKQKQNKNKTNPKNKQNKEHSL
jgi:hypothetical protein